MVVVVVVGVVVVVVVTVVVVVELVVVVVVAVVAVVVVDVRVGGAVVTGGVKIRYSAFPDPYLGNPATNGGGLCSSVSALWGCGQSRHSSLHTHTQGPAVATCPCTAPKHPHHPFEQQRAPLCETTYRRWHVSTSLTQ